MVDVTGISCQEGDDAVFVGGKGQCSISWHQVAEWAGKIRAWAEVNYQWLSLDERGHASLDDLHTGRQGCSSSLPWGPLDP